MEVALPDKWTQFPVTAFIGRVASSYRSTSSKTQILPDVAVNGSISLS
jgi:hypothetical protein